MANLRRGERIARVPRTAENKRVALALLRQHIRQNYSDAYSTLIGAGPGDEADVTGRLRGKLSPYGIKLQLRKAHVHRGEFERAVIDVLESGRNWSFAQVSKEDAAASVYMFFQKVRRPGLIKTY